MKGAKKEVFERNTKRKARGDGLKDDGLVSRNTRQIDLLADSSSSSSVAMHHGLHKRSAIMISTAGRNMPALHRRRD